MHSCETNLIVTKLCLRLHAKGSIRIAANIQTYVIITSFDTLQERVSRNPAMHHQHSSTLCVCRFVYLAPPPPVHKGRKGEFIHEELPHAVPTKADELPFFMEASAAEPAQKRKEEVLA